MTEMDTKIEEAAVEAAKDWVYFEYGNDVREHLGARREAFAEGYKAGWKANPAKWTDEDMIAFAEHVFANCREYQRGGTYVTTFDGVKTMNEILEQYKQSKQK